MGESWTRIRLVARRELRERMRSRAFLISTLIVVAIAVAVALLPRFVGASSTQQVGVVGAVPSAFATALQRSAATTDDEVEVIGYPDAAAAERALTAGDVEVVYDAPAGQLIWQDDPQSQLEADVRAAAQAASVQQQATALGIGAGELQQLLAPPELTNRSIDTIDPDRGTRVAIALAGTVLLFLAIQMSGGFVVSGVVEEKTSRIVEVLLAQVRPYQLLAGKVIGIGTLALAQLLVIGGTGLAAGLTSGTIEPGSLSGPALVGTVVWFVLGFSLYAVAFAAAGALVNRQEDAQSVTFPVMFPLFVGYMISFFVVGEPDAAIARWLSLFPPTAPVLMPLRMQMGVATPAEVAVSVVLMLVAIYGLIRLGGRVYAGAVLRTSGRIKVREALRASRDVVSA